MVPTFSFDTVQTADRNRHGILEMSRQMLAFTSAGYLYCQRLFLLCNPKWRKLVLSFVVIEASEFVAPEFSLSLADNLLLGVTLPDVVDHG